MKSLIKVMLVIVALMFTGCNYYEDQECKDLGYTHTQKTLFYDSHSCAKIDGYLVEIMDYNRYVSISHIENSERMFEITDIK